MPRINLGKKKTYNDYKFKHTSKRDNDIHKYVYNTRRWRSLRINHLADNPLCVRCKEKGKIKSAYEVHHKTPISVAGKDIQMMIKIGFDKNNLESLCKECHKQEHLK